MVFDILNDEVTLIIGLITVVMAVGGILYKGLRWLRNEVTKENERMRKEVNEQNKKIKEEAIERIDQNREDIHNVSNNISMEIKYNNELLSTKLDNIATVAKENKTQIENYSRDIGKTVARNNDKVNDHETRLSIVETKIQTYHNEPPAKTNESYINRHRKSSETENE
jgi:hypothetical protein